MTITMQIYGPLRAVGAFILTIRQEILLVS
jgi:hypothetical protein